MTDLRRILGRWQIHSRSAEVFVVLPEGGPWFAGRAADEDVGMVSAFFIAHAERVAVVSCQAAVGKDGVRSLLAQSDDDKGGWRGRGITAEPFRIGCPDGLRQSVGPTENFDRTIFSVIASGNAEMRLLVGRQRVADVGHSLHQLIPAELLAQVPVV